MLPIRRAATFKVARSAGTKIVTRSIRLTSPVSESLSRSRTLASSCRIAIAPLQQLHQSASLTPTVILRSFATSQPGREEKSTVESVAETVEEVQEEAQETIEEVHEEAQETIEDVRESAAQTIEAVREEAADAIESVREESMEAVGGPEQQVGKSFGSGPRFNAFPHPKNKNVYIGNLSYEMTEGVLKKVVEETLGVEVVTSRIVFDGRGLSRGFGFIQFKDEETAKQAIEMLDQQYLEGRRVSVQYGAHGPREEKKSTTPINPASKTVFIGNLSFDMTDQDLNDLFRSVRGVLEVRVAVDRATSKPRGFAHADFISVEAAEAAVEKLQGKAYYGRTLRIDYSASAREPRGSRGRAVDSVAPAEGDSVPPSS